MSIWTIYGLSDPDDRRIRYIGCTHGDRIERLRGHRYQCLNCRCEESGCLMCWNRGIRERGAWPLLTIIEVGDDRICHGAFAERQWILHHREDRGCDLLNVN